jgi:hypothetical protein
LTRLLMQLAATTARYHAANRDVQSFALKVLEMQMKQARPECQVQCEFGTLPQPDSREQDRLERALNAEYDEDDITDLPI